MDVDIVVIGLGPGGEDAAGALAEAGLSVVGVEERLVGGECPYYACVPTKMMVRAADLLAEGGRIDGMAGSARVEPDWGPVAQRIRDDATDGWDDTAAVERLRGRGARVVRGTAKITGPREVTVGDRVLRPRRGIVIATGTAPAVPPIEGLADSPYWTNREAIRTESVPESLIVMGGGPVGCELAQVFRRFGAEVTVVEALPRLLAAEEPEASDLIRRAFEDEGIDVHTDTKVGHVSYEDGRFTLDRGLSAERLLVATGRRTDLRRLGAGALGLPEDARFIEVDGRMRAGDGLWAIGDVTGKGQFTHVSMYQARIVVGDILGREGAPADYRALPRVTFTDPEVGAVGLTEAQALERGLDVRTHVATGSARGWLSRAPELVKLVESDGVLVGGTAAGPMGGEVLGALAVAVHGQVPVRRLRDMIYAYPTFHRAIDDALH